MTALVPIQERALTANEILANGLAIIEQSREDIERLIEVKDEIAIADSYVVRLVKDKKERREMLHSIDQLDTEASCAIGAWRDRHRRSKGGRPRKKPPHDVEVFTAKEIGYSDETLRRYVKLSQIPFDRREQYYRDIKQTEDERITNAGLYRFYYDASQQMRATVFSHKSKEYYTPLKYLEAAREVMGSIDLDPASCEIAQRNVKAAEYFTEEDDGLLHDWIGNVWLNPPYSKTKGKSNQGIWANKLIDEYKSGNVQQAILLVKGAIGYKWFEELWDDWPVCFTRERISFIKEDGTSRGQSKQGTAFFYFGENIDKFIQVFTNFGRIILPELQK